MRNDIEIVSQSILNHLAKFGLKMHMGNKQTKSKSEAMYFPKSITVAHMTMNFALPIQLNDGQNNIQYMESFKYLGSTIMPDLKEDAEIKTRIGKTWTLMSRFKQVFYSRDVDRRVKYNISVTGPLNLLLWGSETWNLTEANLKKINVFHHSAIRWIFGIKWGKMKEE